VSENASAELGSICGKDANDESEQVLCSIPNWGMPLTQQAGNHQTTGDLRGSTEENKKNSLTLHHQGSLIFCS
jgi:hypothetical protein